MNIRIGDIVRFISEKLEGKVTGIVDNNTVNVYCEEYGFEIPASTSDLVVIHSDFKTGTAAATATPPANGAGRRCSTSLWSSWPWIFPALCRPATRKRLTRC